MTAESAEFEIRRLPGVFACQAGSGGVVVIVDLDADAAMVRTRATEILSLFAPGLPLRVIGGAEVASTAPAVTHRVPVLVGVAGVATLALFGTVAALAGTFSSTHSVKSPPLARRAEGAGAQAPPVTVGPPVALPAPPLAPFHAVVPPSSNAATFAVPAPPALPLISLPVVTPATASVVPLPEVHLPVVPFPVVALPATRRPIEVITGPDGRIDTAVTVTVSMLAHTPVTSHRHAAVHLHRVHTHHERRS